MTDSTPAVSEALDDCLSWAGPIKPGKQVRIIREHIADLTRQLAEAQAAILHVEGECKEGWVMVGEQRKRAETAEAALAALRSELGG